MQYEKEEIRRRILDAAKQEFLENGFEGASIRAIAAKAQTAKSNLYNYFKDKDALFCAVWSRPCSKSGTGWSWQSNSTSPRSGGYTFSSQQIVIGASPVHGLAPGRGEAAALQGAGSSLEGFRHEVLDSFTDNMCA